MTMSRTETNQPFPMHYDEMRSVIDRLLSGVSTLNDEEKHRLRECYVQKNTVYSAAVKMNRSEMEISLWYFYISSALARNALRDLA